MVHLGRHLQQLKEEIASHARERDIHALLLIIDELLDGEGTPAEYARRQVEKQRTLLHNMLPPSVADRMLNGEAVNDVFNEASLLFLDLVDFTKIAATLEPDCVVRLLSTVFRYCDDAVMSCGLTKIKTIGDSYMAVGLPSEDHASTEMAVAAASAASLMLDALHMITITNECGQIIQARIGLHIGPVIAGVIGTERPAYDVWGDAVNVAARMEQTGEPGRIHVSANFAEKVKGGRVQGWKVEERGIVEVKGKGPMRTFWLATSRITE